MSNDPATREFVRHTLATVAYRGAKAIRGAPSEFAGFTGAGKTPVDLLAHMGDLYDWSLRVIQGDQTWTVAQPLPWDQEVQRFFAALEAFDAYLASGEPLRAPLEKLFQGPIADSLTHIGQLAMMRRLSGATMRSENYVVAVIETGRVGVDQAKPVYEF